MAPNGLLQKLYQLDRSSSRFHDQFADILYGEDFRQHVSNIQSDGPVWLVDYLDKVRRRISLLCSLFKLP